MGKDNLVFHTLFWPSYLHAYDQELHLPDVLAINQYLTLQGQKFSKSRGVLADPGDIADQYTLDGLRFYLSTIMPETSDADFTYVGIREAINGKLVSKIGNFINRTANLAVRLDFSAFSPSQRVVQELSSAEKECCRFLEDVQIKRYTERLLSLSDFSNCYITDEKPWLLVNKDSDSYSPEKFLQVMGDCVFLSLGILTIAAPITVDAVEKFESQTGLPITAWPEDLTAYLTELTKKWSLSDKPSPLFLRVP